MSWLYSSSVSKFFALLVVAALLAACSSTQVGDQGVASVTPLPPVQETAVLPTATLPATAVPPTVSATATPEEGVAFTPRFDRFLPFAQQDGKGGLSGLVRQGEGWQGVSVPYPPDFVPGSGDYAPASDRLLAWGFSRGAGPGSLAVGPLSIINLATQVQELVIAEDVVSAGWAPNGLDFAYIMATPDTYELRWRGSTGEDRLLAVDVPHSLRISPDGRFVAFTRESRYGLDAAVPGVYVVAIETGQEIQVSTLDRAGNGGIDLLWKPHWSPDGSQLILYATGATDSAGDAFENGYVWAAADGSFSYFLPESAFLGHFEEPMSAPENRPCLSAPPLFVANRMVFTVGECLPMSSEQENATPAVFALDPQTGTITSVETLSVAESAELLAWDVPGESVLVEEDGRVVSHVIPQP